MHSSGVKIKRRNDGCAAGLFASTLTRIMLFTNPKPLALQVRADLFNGLATMEKAGLPLSQALAVLRLPGKAQARMEKMKQLTARGVDIASAGARSGLFSPFEVNLVRAAQQAGSPASTYRRLAERYSQQAQQRATLKSRLSMPIFVLVFALCVQPLPSLVAGTISGWGYALQILRPLALLAGAAYLIHRFKTRFVRYTMQLPLFGAMQVRQANREFFAGMALLLEAGIPMFDALPKAVDTIDNDVIRRDFSNLKRRMTRGATFTQAVEELHYLGNDQVIGFIQTGETSGTLPEMLWRFVAAETQAIVHWQQEMIAWLPRIIYTLIVLWMAYGMLTGGAFMPNLPSELR